MSQIILHKQDESFQNSLTLCSILAKPYMVRILYIINKCPLTYTGILTELGLTKKHSGRFAYYMRDLTGLQFVKIDRQTSLYFLTFKGQKTIELMDCVNKVANLNIGNFEHAMERIQINLNINRNWLEPLIKSELQKVVKGFYRK